MKSYERKHLHMQIFHKNKDSRSKDQNKNELYFIPSVMELNWIDDELLSSDFAEWSCTVVITTTPRRKQ